jgi:hypothetical protein
MADVPMWWKLRSLRMGKGVCSTPSYVVASHMTGLLEDSARMQLGGQIKHWRKGSGQCERGQHRLLPHGPKVRLMTCGWRRRKGPMIAWGIFASRVTRLAKTVTSEKTRKCLNDNRRTRSVMFLAWPRIARTTLKVAPSAAP